MDNSNPTGPESPAADTLGNAVLDLSPISVAEIIERNAALTWPEAVAILAEACHLTVSTYPEASTVPSIGRVHIFSDGSMRIVPGGGGLDLASAARLLDALARGWDTQQPQRLLINEAVAADKFWLVAELGEALAYHERQKHAELIRSAFERVRSSKPAAASASVPAASTTHVRRVRPTPAPWTDPSAPALVPVPDRAPAAESSPVSTPIPNDDNGKPWANVRVPLWLVALVVFGAVPAFALWFLGIGQANPGLPQLPNVEEKPQAEVAAQDTKWLEPLLLPLALQGFDGPITAESARIPFGARMLAATSAGPRRPASGPAASVLLTGAAASLSPLAIAPSTTPTIGLGTTPPPEVAPRPVAVSAPPPAAPVQTATAYRSAPPEPAIAPRATPVAEVDQRIYTSESPDVVPPVPFDAKALPSNAGSGGTSAQNRMELVIGINGRVEEVKMASRPARMSDMMMLSGAKNWVFTPATKDGKPVRYRLPLTWTVSQ